MYNWFIIVETCILNGLQVTLHGLRGTCDYRVFVYLYFIHTWSLLIMHWLILVDQLIFGPCWPICDPCWSPFIFGPCWPTHDPCWSVYIRSLLTYAWSLLITFFFIQFNMFISRWSYTIVRYNRCYKLIYKIIISTNKSQQILFFLKFLNFNIT